ncbi:unnamed protein product [Owenia fusiformis]|uniref:Uncharacterized protein n=1 Tax=Owenia fusiformis TaxID=6347 RepID=A0A8J1T6L4_OWEFU|nr:unnamed protein product [Owenia fusiformis]
MAKALVQGASRGLGLQFCRHILERSPSAAVVATCRNPEEATQLKLLKSSYPNNLRILQIDVTREDHVQLAAASVKDDLGSLDLLINSAGILHPSKRGETSLKDVTAHGLEATFRTNTLGPMIMAKYFSPLLLKGQGAFGLTDRDKPHKGIIVNISAKVGSITDNGLGGWYSYRLSKTALNMATKNLSIELGRGKNKVICVSFHPGTVDSDLSRPYHKGVPEGKLFSVEHSVNLLMNNINNLKLENSGQFLNWDGTQLPY